MNKRLPVVLITVALMLFLSSCLPRAAVSAPTQLPPTDPPAVQTDGQEPTAKAAEESQDPKPTDTPETLAEKAEPTARVGLQATDPETVMLGSGDIQLVEFFAFW